MVDKQAKKTNIAFTVIVAFRRALIVATTTGGRVSVASLPLLPRCFMTFPTRSFQFSFS